MSRTDIFVVILSVLLLITACENSELNNIHKDPVVKDRHTSSNNDNLATKKGENAKNKVNNNRDNYDTEKEIEVCFMGDVMMDSHIGNYIQEYGVDYPWSDVSTITKEADISVINLETSVSERGTTKKPKGYGFRSKPYTLEGLRNSGIDLVSLANNHVLDFGLDAFDDTLKNLDKYNIKYIGAGSNLKEAEDMVIIEKNGIKMGFLGYSSIIPWVDWRADSESPGVAPLYPSDYNRVLKNIKDASNKCDILTVIIHWGIEYTDYPTKEQAELAHSLIDNGADVIIGHHPHVIQGIEIYNNRPILYSVGNFIFLKRNEKAGETGIFKLVFNKNGFVKGYIYPIYIKYCKANLISVDDDKGKKIIDRIIKLSSEFDTYITKKGEILINK